MTIPAFRSKGAYGTGTTSCTAAVPTGGDAPQTNDILIITVESSDSTTAAGTPSTPLLWTKVFERTQGDGATGVTTLTIFGKRAGVAELDVTIDGVGNHCSASMFVFSGCVTSGDAWVAGTGTGADTGEGSILDVTTPESDCLVLMVVGASRDANSTTHFNSFTNSNLSSITEREDNLTSTGAGGGIGVAEGGKASAGATGDTTIDVANTASPWNSVHIVLKPATSSNNAELAKTLDALVSSGAGTVTVTGSLALTFGVVSSASAGDVTITATLAQTLAALVSVSSGNVTIEAILAKTLSELASSGSGNVDVSSALGATLALLVSSGSGNVDVTGILTQTLGALISTASGNVTITGELMQTLGALLINAHANVDVDGIIAQTLSALTSAGSANVAVGSTSSQTLGALTLLSSGNVSVTGSLSQVLSVLTLIAAASVPVSGFSQLGYVEADIRRIHTADGETYTAEIRRVNKA